MKTKLIFLCLCLFTSTVFAQDLMQERIWKLSPRKKSIYLDRGIFHLSSPQSAAQIVSVRNSYDAKTGYERVVIDFNSNTVPSVYGHISTNTKKVYLDFFDTKLAKTISSLKNTKFVDNLDFFSIDQETLSIELSMKDKNTFDVFYLEAPGRIVVDIKK
ncbi:MAG: hypothetical protein JNM93_10435 [Bacteriovoracaceae bacterium]|nr:hypothetical protein [Bacteriovoracaceae bacterium]